ncbi:hypothetical protein, partial [Sphingomonas sp. 10B4]|uniref:hypothetical protein n=1 Tax=Sphingomonas sp. 10B4 TaxID=3048575 RepID=UPI002B23DB82
ITSLMLDSSLFGDPAWGPSWNRKELTDGYMPEITALQVDGDRDNPKHIYSDSWSYEILSFVLAFCVVMVCWF